MPGRILEQECKSSMESVSHYRERGEKCGLTFAEPSLARADRRQGPHSCPEKKRDDHMSKRRAGSECPCERPGVVGSDWT